MPDLRRRARVLDADPALAGLLEEWLAEAGCVIAPDGAADLIVVDVPIPRWGGAEALRRLAGEHAGTPILALSSNFLPGVGGSATVARALGVAAVLPKPVTREALLGAVEKLLGTA